MVAVLGCDLMMVVDEKHRDEAPYYEAVARVRYVVVALVKIPEVMVFCVDHGCRHQRSVIVGRGLRMNGSLLQMVFVNLVLVRSYYYQVDDEQEDLFASLVLMLDQHVNPRLLMFLTAYPLGSHDPFPSPRQLMIAFELMMEALVCQEAKHRQQPASEVSYQKEW